MPGTQSDLSVKLFMHFLPVLSSLRGAPRAKVIGEFAGGGGSFDWAADLDRTLEEEVLSSRGPRLDYLPRPHPQGPTLHRQLEGALKVVERILPPERVLGWASWGRGKWVRAPRLTKRNPPLSDTPFGATPVRRRAQTPNWFVGLD